jgi:Holliday junction resolvase-like predicted endonuclease
MHISYSSIKDAQDCSYRFKLKVVDGIKIYRQSIDTIFGSLMHQCIQDFLLKKRDVVETKRYFHSFWKTFWKLYKAHLDPAKVRQFLRAGINILDHMEAAFEGCEVLTVEEKLAMPIVPERPDVEFLGFIDLVMFRKDQLIIVDLKTTGSAFMFMKYLDDIKRHQLTLYKSYYSKKHDIDLTDIDICFVVLEKSPTSKNPIVFVPDHAGIERIQDAQNLVRRTLDLYDHGPYPKNLSACHNAATGITCPYYKTEHCINEEEEEEEGKDKKEEANQKTKKATPTKARRAHGMFAN